MRPLGVMGRSWIRGGVLAAAAALAVGAWAPSASSSNDPYFPEQWNLTQVNAPAAWTRSTGAGVKIGVVDTGIDLTHEDLAAKVSDSVSCIGARDLQQACTGSAQDDQGHGTHVAGIAAAVTGNNKGVAGVAPDAKLVIVKALGASGSGALNDVNAGIKWAVDRGARVINLSLESDGQEVTTAPGQTLTEGVDYAYNHNAIVVVAAGNATPSLFGQAGYANVNAVIVGASGRTDQVTWYSSSLAGAKWALVAPGGDARGPDGRASCAGALATDCVVSTGWFSGKTNQYADDEGTSMATPHVAGAIALVMAQTPSLSAAAAVQRVLATVDHVPCGDGCRGRLDVAAAVGAPVPPPATTTTAPAPGSAPAGSAPSGAAGPPPAPALTGGASPAVNAAPPGSVPNPAPVPPATLQPGAPLAAGAPQPLSTGQVARVRPPDRHVPGFAVALALVALALVAAEAGLMSRRAGGFGAVPPGGEGPTSGGAP